MAYSAWIPYRAGDNTEIEVWVGNSKVDYPVYRRSHATEISIPNETSASDVLIWFVEGKSRQGFRVDTKGIAHEVGLRAVGAVMEGLKKTLTPEGLLRLPDEAVRANVERVSKDSIKESSLEDRVYERVREIVQEELRQVTKAVAAHSLALTQTISAPKKLSEDTKVSLSDEERERLAELLQADKLKRLAVDDKGTVAIPAQQPLRAVAQRFVFPEPVLKQLFEALIVPVINGMGGIYAKAEMAATRASSALDILNAAMAKLESVNQENKAAVAATVHELKNTIEALPTPHPSGYAVSSPGHILLYTSAPMSSPKFQLLTADGKVAVRNDQLERRVGWGGGFHAVSLRCKAPDEVAFVQVVSTEYTAVLPLIKTRTPDNITLKLPSSVEG